MKTILFSLASALVLLGATPQADAADQSAVQTGRMDSARRHDLSHRHRHHHWVPGHYSWHHGYRVWVPGHYVIFF